MSNGNDWEFEEIPGYDPRTDPDSKHYDPDYDEDAPDPWDNPDWDPFDEAEPKPDESESIFGVEKICFPEWCRKEKGKDGKCFLKCYEHCSDGSKITTFTLIDCEDFSEKETKK